ncbi:MAG: hypothetical protein EAZ97_15010 [Bacteroidetes bacterium]|nr:MAG: hypothetical protein EAZ97_15010 [Bacteroidota bacterium]
MKYLCLIYILFFAFIQPIYAQNNPRLDLLISQLEISEPKLYDSLLTQIDREQALLPFGEAIKYANKVIKVAETLPYPYAIPQAYRNLSAVYVQNKEEALALDYDFQALQLADKYENRYEVARCIDRIAQLYDNQGNTVLALEYELSAADVFQELKYMVETAHSFYQIAEIHQKVGSFDRAVEYYEKAIEIGADSLNAHTQALYFKKTGLAQEKLENYQNALQYLYRSLQIAEKMKDNRLIGEVNGLLGLVFKKQGNQTIALRYMEGALKISTQAQDWQNVSKMLNYLGEIHGSMGNYVTSQNYYDQALATISSSNLYDELEETFKGLSNLNLKMRNFEKAYQYQSHFIAVKDSLLRKKDALKLAKIQASFDFEKKQAQIETLMQDNAVSGETIRIQNIVNWTIGGALGVVLLMAFALFRSNAEKKKVNQRLQEQNDEIYQQKNEISLQRDELEEKGIEISAALEAVDNSNKRLTHSLNYAKHIQSSIFPTSEKMSASLTDHFIFFKPKDIVSGDFYWFFSQSHRSILAAIDCTGHGVPGAFISMIGNDLMNEIVILKGFSEPDQILNELHKSIRATLRQKETSNRDGMDMSLCVIHQTPKNMENVFGKPRIEFAGAKNPIIYIQENEVFEIKGNKMPIGGDQREDERIFTKHTIILEKPTTLYLFSDGFQDQFGGEQGRKYTPKRFYALLQEIHEKPMQTQCQILESTLENWRKADPSNSQKQIDDIMVIGVKV